MLFPVAVDVPMARWPWMNWAMMLLIAVCFVMQWSNPDGAERFVLGINGYPSGIFDRDPFASFFSMPSLVNEHSLSWLGHMFLHLDVFHLAGNLIFMWVFGNAVCAKVGNVLYVPLWLGTGVTAAACERIFEDVPMLGASGAIFGVVGFYVVFYLFNDITMFWYVFFRFGVFRLTSYWVVASYVALDLVGMLRAEDGIAHLAHLGGAAAGFGVAMAALKLGLLSPTRAERTLLDVLQRRRPLTPKLFADRPFDPDDLRRELYVHLGQGQVKRMKVGELVIRRDSQTAVDGWLVSEDANRWMSFKEWREAHER